LMVCAELGGKVPAGNRRVDSEQVVEQLELMVVGLDAEVRIGVVGTMMPADMIGISALEPEGQVHEEIGDLGGRLVGEIGRHWGGEPVLEVRHRA